MVKPVILLEALRKKMNFSLMLQLTSQSEFEPESWLLGKLHKMNFSLMLRLTSQSELEPESWLLGKLHV
ncbi:unnamed protein product [Strongylus vulgaris]|uniref:Uncharacterized protein n=1 Tax=Strongylus vulgaris TaxID=40348 RepID=A0A3P7JX34_STRVU|nr:unnamed protein product [Strongylus vulgaris]